jgi:hypothetical protein
MWAEYIFLPGTREYNKPKLVLSNTLQLNGVTEFSEVFQLNPMMIGALALRKERYMVGVVPSIIFRLQNYDDFESTAAGLPSVLN